MVVSGMAGELLLSRVLILWVRANRASSPGTYKLCLEIAGATIVMKKTIAAPIALAYRNAFRSNPLRGDRPIVTHRRLYLDSRYPGVPTNSHSTRVPLFANHRHSRNRL